MSDKSIQISTIYIYYGFKGKILPLLFSIVKKKDQMIMDFLYHQL